MFQKYNLEKKTEEIVNWITKKFTGKNRLPKASFNTQNGDLISNKHILRDLGDYLPYLAWFKKKDFCESQIKELKNHLKEGILEPEDERFFPISLVSPITPAFAHTDLIWGLLLYHYKKKRKPRLFRTFKSILNDTLEAFWKNNFIESFYLHRFGGTIPVFDSRDSMYVELLALSSKITSNSEYLSLAKNLHKSIRNIPTFQSYSMFPKHHVLSGEKVISKVPAISRNMKTIQLMKHNTNTIFAFLELYRNTQDSLIKEDIYKWKNGLEELALRDGFRPSHLVKLKRGGVLRKRPTLTSSFAVIDLLCDCAYEFDDKDFLRLAEKIAKYWINLQSSETGLFPLYPNQNKSHLDSETDMIISLWKIAELTNDDRYKKAGKRTFEGILNHHYTKNGYADSVNIQTGEILDPTAKVKYQALLLKPFILFLTKNQSIYKNKYLFEILKDR